MPVRKRNKIQFYQTITVVEVRVRQDKSDLALMPYLGLVELPVRICDSTAQLTRDLPNLSRCLKTPDLPITSGTLSACRSFEAKND